MATKLKLAVILTLALFIGPFYSWADSRTVMSSAYLGSDADPGSSFCQYSMTSQQAGNSPAAFLLSYANTPERMIQFLYDSRVIFSPLFQDALLQTLMTGGVQELQDLGLLSTNLEQTLKSNWRKIPFKKVRQSISSLKKVYDLDDQRLAPLVWNVLDNQIILVNKEDNVAVAEAHVQFLRDLKEALKESPNRPIFEAVMAQLARESVISTAVKFVGLYNQLLDKRKSDRALPPVFSAFPFAIGIAFAHYILTGQLDDPSIPVAWGAMYTYPLYLAYSIPENLLPFGRKIKSESVVYKVSPDYAKQIEVTSKDLFAKVDDAAAAMVDLESACSRDVCELTPVQIVNLGQVDRLALDRMKTELASVIQSNSLTAALNKVRQAATKVRNKETDFEAHISLGQSLKDLRQELKSIDSIESTAVQNLIQRVNSVRHSLEKLQNRPYDILTRDNTNQDQVWRLALLGRQISGDLASLRNLRVSTEALSARLEKLRALARQVEELIKNLPRSPDGWRATATNISNALDGIQI